MHIMGVFTKLFSACFFFPRIQIFCYKLCMPLRGRPFPIILMKVFLNYFCKRVVQVNVQVSEEVHCLIADRFTSDFAIVTWDTDMCLYRA